MSVPESDYFSLLREYIERLINTRLQSWPELMEILQIRQYQKNQLIVREGQQFINEAFLAEGIFRCFLTDSTGEEINTAFYEAPKIVAPYLTRNINHKHLVNFQAITPCTLLLFDAPNFSGLIRKYPDIREFAYQVIENELRFKAAREIIFISKTASERLQFFRETYPGLENKIPQHIIASFLGITIVSLSRLRRKKALGKRH